MENDGTMNTSPAPSPELQALVEASAGMDVDQLAEELAQAARPPKDPQALAAYLLSMSAEAA